jgi:GTP pyrophosphokinase
MLMIFDALALADEKLSGLVRYNDLPLLDHSVGTAEIVVSEIGLGRNSVIATLLHDVVRLELMSIDEVETLYETTCSDIINGMTSISGINANISDSQADNIRELIISYSTDPRVILIKLADRLEVMRTLEIFPHEKREKKSWESLNLYAKIAHKLGLYAIKSELEDLSLKYLHPADYKHITEKLSEGAEERQRFIDKFLLPIEEKLKESGVHYHIKSRTKSIYSIWTKMRKQKVGVDEIYDIFAIRIIIDCPTEDEKSTIWSVYSIVTNIYQPDTSRLRDWVTNPKPNGYESLHTTVATPEGKWVEIQIRTERMDEVAERGIAAHWRYKGVNQGEMSSEEWLARLRELIESKTESTVSTKNFDATLSTNEIIVYTPTGDLRKLPIGATVLDFAFHIHTNVGATCVGGRVNEHNVSIKHTLQHGDIVQVLTSKSQKPKADWLNLVHTNRARNKIRAYMREEEAKAAILGREELERKIKNWKLSIAIDDAVTLLCKHYKVRTGTELYNQIAEEKIDIAEIKDIITRHLSGELDEERRVAAAAIHPKTAPTKATNNSDTLVIDDKIKNLDYKFAKCCNPIFGDDVFGFVTRTTGITIHRDDCPNAARMKELYSYRVMNVRWRENAREGAFRATIRITAEDQTGIVNRITDVITQELKLNIRSSNFSPRGEILSGTINVEVPSNTIVDMLVHKILGIKGVQKAYRVNL